VDEPLRAIALPVALGIVALGLLVVGAVEPLNPVAAGLAAACLVAVLARATLIAREHAALLRASRDEALVDALTGLGNRRALTGALAERLPEARRSRPLVLALFDLDGFKAYNDTFGHPAGDALLARLGGNLAALLEGRGQAFRMGGDEFCALLETSEDCAEPFVLSAAAALSEHGDGFSVSCSHGAVVLPAEAREGTEALRIADRRMYAHKQANRASAGRQSADVLLRALAERDPGLGTHAEAVALAVAVAEALGLRPEGVECVRQAAELHDVGKVAIPDAILGKPGPLTEEEWAFVRRHPAIGERIVLAAPALARVGALVRASHERWDGRGYPDGLEGEAIPLGARIVAVADAFAAMTAGRPYRAARRPPEALGELRRQAGAQFDPAVVEAWCAARARRAVPAR
jgi:diguanylate cyclase (GGDEF)-like protein